MTAPVAEPQTRNVGRRPAHEPYIGPRDIPEGWTLYGRSRELHELVSMLLAERIAVLHGPSGAGKTSLIQAALIPELRDTRRFLVYGPTRVGREPPPDLDPAHVNRYVLSTLVGLEQQRAREAEASVTGATPSPVAAHELAAMSIPDYLTGRESDLAPDRRVVLIVDQLEEVFSQNADDPDAKLEFFRQLGDALRPEHRWALFSIREGYVAALDRYAHLVPTRLAHHYDLELLDAAGAREAIAGPAVLPEAIVDQLVTSLQLAPRPGSPAGVRGRYVEPVQLQLVCRRLWERLRESDDVAAASATLTGTIGDVNSALGEYYAEVVARVSRDTGVAEAAIRRWFERALIHGDVRSPSPLGAEAECGLAGSGVRAAVEALREAYLIRLEEGHSFAWYELAHDRWVEPVKENNRAWLEQHASPVERYAKSWQSSGCPAGGLLRGAALGEAQAWASAHPDDVTPDVQAFLTASFTSERDADQYRIAELARWNARLKRLNRWLLGLLVTVVALTAVSLVTYRRFHEEEMRTGIRRRGNERQRTAVRTSYGISAAEVRAERNELLVTYHTRREEDRRVEQALADLGFDFRLVPSNRPPGTRPNLIKYGRLVDSTAVKLVALALMRADRSVSLQYICPEDEEVSGDEIQVRYTRSWADSTPITLRQIRSDPTTRIRRGTLKWHCPP